MRILKTLLWVLGGLLAVLLLGGLALPGHFHVERSIWIQAAPDKISALVADPHRWKEWTVWNRRDPAMAIEYFGAASGAGSGWAWKSKTEGDGRMTLNAVVPGRRVAYELYFPDMDSSSSGELQFTAEAGATRVLWTMDGDMGRNPLMHWMALLMNRMVGPDFDAGLAHLKQLAEQP